ncbi:unnamed protein product [Sphenostylis stenocarpa]|uniref:Prolamin-like domain-containing protein n=1 Tax=Sphenostylis stenocarpa TaxID=92480 RepID=A0AA87B8W7_9FABA|nr:unnamed protein product [Sphenostylis stenocarpa]
MAEITAPDKEESLLECARHIGSYCGNEVLDSLPSHAKTTVSADCCYKIIQTGYSCHTRLTLFVLQSDSEYKHANLTRVLAKNDKIFHKCDYATQPESQRYLSKCVEKIGIHCGKEVFDKLVYNKNNITGCCCDKLVDMGLRCHINMVKALIRTPALRDIDAVQFLKKSKKIFHQCQPREE